MQILSVHRDACNAQQHAGRVGLYVSTVRALVHKVQDGAVHASTYKSNASNVRAERRVKLYLGGFETIMPNREVNTQIPIECRSSLNYTFKRSAVVCAGYTCTIIPIIQRRSGIVRDQSPVRRVMTTALVPGFNYRGLSYY